MSYDVSLEMDAGGPSPMDYYVGNYTSNVVPIWTKAMYGHEFAGFDGRQARECVPYLDEGIRQIETWPERFRELEPENGWGNLEGAMEYLVKCRDAFLRYPLATVKVCR